MTAFLCHLFCGDFSLSHLRLRAITAWPSPDTCLGSQPLQDPSPTPPQTAIVGIPPGRGMLERCLPGVGEMPHLVLGCSRLRIGPGRSPLNLPYICHLHVDPSFMLSIPSHLHSDGNQHTRETISKHSVFDIYLLYLTCFLQRTSQTASTVCLGEKLRMRA